MPMRLGPGPVFVHESIAATRRWQLYALRALFVLGLLAGLGIVGFLTWLEAGKPVGSVSLQQLAELGEVFYYTISTIQLMLVMIVAPAATAGAICLDRARGSLTHMLATDLRRRRDRAGQAGGAAPARDVAGRRHRAGAGAGRPARRGHHRGHRRPDADHPGGGRPRLHAGPGDLGPRHQDPRGPDGGLRDRIRLGALASRLVALEAIGILRGKPDWLAGINPFVLAWAPYAWPSYLSLEWLAGVLGGMTRSRPGWPSTRCSGSGPRSRGSRPLASGGGIVDGPVPRMAVEVAAGAVAGQGPVLLARVASEPAVAGGPGRLGRVHPAVAREHGGRRRRARPISNRAANSSSSRTASR